MVSDQTTQELIDRLAPLSPDEVESLMIAVTKDMLAVAESLNLVDCWFSLGDNSGFINDLLPPGARVMRQSHEDHGSRLMNVSDTILAQGYRRILMVQADCPTIDAEYIEVALDALVGSDAVIGPSTGGGGYVLIGLSKPIPRLFLEIEMGTPDVLIKTLLRARELDLHMNVVPQRRGFDSLQDLKEAAMAGELTHAPHTLAAWENMPT